MDIGDRIRRLRLQRGLTQEELADRCELSKSFISQLERDKTDVSFSSLQTVIESLGCDLKTFFSEPDDEKLVFSEADVSVKADPDGLRGEMRWLIPSAQKYRMEPVLLAMDAGGETPEDDPHEGEEFGYVLSGSVRIELGEKTVRARKGESFYFRPASPHRLKNAGKTECRVLWVSTPPSF